MNATPEHASPPLQAKRPHWATEYIGKPWVRGARGPDAFDCWGLFLTIYKQRYGLTLPDAPNLELKDFYRLINHAVKGPYWEEVQIPFEGCGVGMGGTEYYHHVGIYLEVDRGLILHSANLKNIVAQSINSLKASGMGRMSFYKHHGARYRS